MVSAPRPSEKIALQYSFTSRVATFPGQTTFRSRQSYAGKYYDNGERQKRTPLSSIAQIPIDTTTKWKSRANTYSLRSTMSTGPIPSRVYQSYNISSLCCHWSADWCYTWSSDRRQCWNEWWCTSLYLGWLTSILIGQFVCLQKQTFYHCVPCHYHQRTAEKLQRGATEPALALNPRWLPIGL